MRKIKDPSVKNAKQKKKFPLHPFELVWYILCGLVGIWGLTYIVSNEISVLAKLIRDSRAKAHCTDNETLDLLDDVNKVIEMTEGRRDRRDNKSFQDLFNDINRRLSDYVAKVEPQWREIFDKLIKEANASQPEKAPEQA